MNEIIIEIMKEGIILTLRVAESLVMNWSFNFAIKYLDLIIKI